MDKEQERELASAKADDARIAPQKAVTLTETDEEADTPVSKVTLIDEESVDEPPKDSDPAQTPSEEKKDEEDDSQKDPAPEGDEKNPPHSKTRRIIHEIASYVLIICCAFLFAFLVNHFLLINANVPTGSMENTIMPKDRLFGSRIHYLFTDPKRGDVVIFTYPDDGETSFIKRIIGLPGETIEIRDGKVYINNSETPLNEPYIKEEYTGSWGPYEIPEDSYFMLGDNRKSSKDSRYWVNKFVSRDKILGKALFTYWPFDHAGIFKSVDYGF